MKQFIWNNHQVSLSMIDQKFAYWRNQSTDWNKLHDAGIKKSTRSCLRADLNRARKIDVCTSNVSMMAIYRIFYFLLMTWLWHAKFLSIFYSLNILTHFELKNVGPVKEYLGSGYITKIASKFGLEMAKSYKHLFTRRLLYLRIIRVV